MQNIKTEYNVTVNTLIDMIALAWRNAFRVNEKITENNMIITFYTELEKESIVTGSFVVDKKLYNEIRSKIIKTADSIK